MIKYGDYVVDEGGRKLARLAPDGWRIRVLRLPRCTIGDFFAILTWLNELGYVAI